MATPHRGARAARAALLALAACACACAGAAHEPGAPPPRVAGQARPPAPPRFISPHSYEWFVRAELLLARGERAKAVEAYRLALAGAEEDPYVLARLADALDQAGDARGADEALQAGLELDPQSEAIWLALGRIAARRGDTARAFAAYERAEAAASGAPDAPLALAELLQRRGHPERAIAVLERLAEHSAQGDAPLLQARLQLASARGDGAALALAARQYLEHGGGDPELVRRSAGELLAAGNAALAARLLAPLPQTDRDARLRLDALLALSELDAVELLLATTPPQHVGGPLAVAEAYLAIGRPARALELLSEQSAAEDPDPQRRTLLHARAMQAAGRYADAATAAASIPSTSIHHPAARQTLVRALKAGGLPALAQEVAR
jgi:tetratricopeptide (TPR) repeat protein